MVLTKVKTKLFYGSDADAQLNKFIDDSRISDESVLDVKLAMGSSGSNATVLLLVYKAKMSR